MSTRKKWWTQTVAVGGEFRTSPGLHRSKRAAYDHVNDLRDTWQPGKSTQVRVYVDEGNGRELYETVDLAAGPAADPEDWFDR